MKIRFDEKKLRQLLSDVKRMPLPGEGAYPYKRDDLDPKLWGTIGEIDDSSLPKEPKSPPPEDRPLK